MARAQCAAFAGVLFLQAVLQLSSCKQCWCGGFASMLGIVRQRVR
jgi:hypothetical protein